MPLLIRYRVQTCYPNVNGQEFLSAALEEAVEKRLYNGVPCYMGHDDVPPAFRALTEHELSPRDDDGNKLSLGTWISAYFDGAGVVATLHCAVTSSTFWSLLNYGWGFSVNLDALFLPPGPGIRRHQVARHIIAIDSIDYVMRPATVDGCLIDQTWVTHGHVG
jgi:hypothetical protein